MTSDGLLSDAQRLAWLRLIRSDNVGPITFRELVNHFGSASAALDAVPELARRGGRVGRVFPREDAERELEAASAMGVQLIAIGEPGYPSWLRAIDSAPPLLAVRGDVAALARPAVGVVGSRNASIAGRKFAMQISVGVGGSGFVVASGLARGIDAAAHEASLTSGTVAVFAGGLARLYPPENAGLAERILESGGAHVSEMPLNHTPRGKDFPRRNRIISGLSAAVVVVEGALRSGSLITARCAADQGRLVFAVPGSPLDPRAGGTNQLIKDGAHIVTAVGDILDEIAPMLGRSSGPSDLEEPGYDRPIARDAEDSDRTAIVTALGPTPSEIDEIIRHTGLSPAVVRLVLLELELSGRIEHHPGGRISLVP